MLISDDFLVIISSKKTRFKHQTWKANLKKLMVSIYFFVKLTNCCNSALIDLLIKEEQPGFKQYTITILLRTKCINIFQKITFYFSKKSEIKCWKWQDNDNLNRFNYLFRSANIKVILFELSDLFQMLFLFYYIFVLFIVLNF